MKFRPCIDIHNGKVKQIVGGSLRDAGDCAEENFVSELGAADYAKMYRERGLSGGHVILLNPVGSEFYGEDLRQAKEALRAYPGGLQVGGGITCENAMNFLDAGASHVIVTSYVFSEGEIRYDRLRELKHLVGKERLVLDLSCRERDGTYYIVTNRWQKFTSQPLHEPLLAQLSEYCDEFLVHGVSVEGTSGGIDRRLVEILAGSTGIPITYAGGIGTYEDIEMLRDLSEGKIHYTIGSALDLFGGSLEFEVIVTKYCDLN